MKCKLIFLKNIFDFKKQTKELHLYNFFYDSIFNLMHVMNKMINQSLKENEIKENKN